MPFRRILPLLLLAFGASLAAAPRDDAAVAPPRPVDPARLKAQEAGKQRLLAKLRADAPKLDDGPSRPNPLDAPIFHRHDRP